MASKSKASNSGFGAWLREERLAQGRKQREIAARLEMDSSHLAKIERGERLPPPELAEPLAGAYGLELKLLRANLAMARTAADFGDDPEVLAAAGQLLCEAAAAVNKTVNKRPNKK